MQFQCSNFVTPNKDKTDQKIVPIFIKLVNSIGKYTPISSELIANKINSVEFMKVYIGKEIINEEEIPNHIEDIVSQLELSPTIMGLTGNIINIMDLRKIEIVNSNFNTKEELSAVNTFSEYITNLLNIDLQPTQTGLKNTVKLVSMPKSFFYKNEQFNPKNYIEEQLKKDIENLKNKLENALPEHKTVIAKRIEFYDRLYNDFKTNTSELSIFNMARQKVDRDLNITFRTTEELREEAERNNELTKNWDDSQNFKTDTQEIFRTATKLFLSNLKDKSLVLEGIEVYNAIDEISGKNKQLDLQVIIPKLQYHLLGAINKQTMLNRLEELRYVYGWMPNMIDTLKNDKELQNSFFTDFNKANLNEELLMLSSKVSESGVSTKNGNVITQNKSQSVKLADKVLSSLKYNILYNVYTTENVDKMISTLTQYNEKLKEYKKDTFSLEQAVQDLKVLEDVVFELRIKFPIDTIKTYILAELTKRKLKNGKDIELNSFLTSTKMFVNNFNNILYEIKTIKAKTDKITNKDYKVIMSKINALTKAVLPYNKNIENLMYFDGKSDKKYGIRLPQLLTDFENMLHEFANKEVVFGEVIDKTNFEYLIEELEKLPNFKHSNWFGENGVFTTNGKLNKEKLQQFKFSILSQIKNLDINEMVEYKDFNNTNWLLTSLIAYVNGSYQDRENNNNIVRIPCPTPSDSSIMEFYTVPKFDTSEFQYQYDLTKEAIIALGNDYVLADSKRDYLNNAVKLENDIVLVGQDAENNETYNKLIGLGYKRLIFKGYNGKLHAVFTKKAYKEQLTINKNETLNNSSLTALLNIAKQELKLFVNAKKLIFADNGELRNDILNINLPNNSYFKFKTFKDVQDDIAKGKIVYYSEQPGSNDLQLTRPDRFVRVFKVVETDKDGNVTTNYMGNLFNFKHFPGLISLFDKNTLKTNKALTDDVLTKVIFDFINDEVTKFNEFHSEAINKVRPYLLTNQKNNVILLDFFINRLINNVEFDNLFLGESESIIASNKRAKAPHSGALTMFEYKNITNDNIFGKVLNVQDLRTNSEKIANTREMIKGQIDTLVKQRRKHATEQLDKIIKNKEAVNKLVDEMCSPYEGGTVRTDGQILITINFFVKQVKESGQWDTYSQFIDEKEINGKMVYSINPNTKLEDLKLLFKPGKPFLHTVRTMLADKNNTVSYAQQIKSSYIIAVPELIADGKLKEVVNYMIDNNIDILSFDSTQKKQTTNSYLLFDDNGDFDVNLIKGVNTDEFAFHDFRTILEVAQEELDNTSKIGIQVAKIMLSNIAEEAPYLFKDLTGKELKKYIHHIQSANIITALNKIVEKFAIETEEGFVINKVEVSNFLKSASLNKDRVEAANILKVIDNEFVIPLSFPVFQKNFISLFTSMFKNKITNQKTMGGHFVLFSDAFRNLYDVTPVMREQDNENLGKELKAIKLDNGTLILECYISQYTKEILMGDKTIDLNTVPESLRTIVGYRIPSTGQQSMVVLKIVGVLPPHIKSSIVVNNEIITRTGTDFDVDSLYLMFKSGDRRGLKLKEYAILNQEDFKNYNILVNRKQKLYEQLTEADYDIEGLAEKQKQYLGRLNDRLNSFELVNLDEDLNNQINNVIKELDEIEQKELANQNILITSSDKRQINKIKSEAIKIQQLRSRLTAVLNDLKEQVDYQDDGSINENVEKTKKQIERIENKLKQLVSSDNIITKLWSLKEQLPKKVLKSLQEFEDIKKEILTKQYYQFDKLDYNFAMEDLLEFQPKVIRDNKLIEAYISILTNDNHFLITTRGSNFDRLQSVADKQAPLSTFTSPLSQDILKEKATMGKLMLPITASLNLTTKLFEQLKVNTPFDIKITIKKEDTVFNYKELRKLYDNVKETEFTYIITHNRLGHNGLNRNLDGNLIADCTGEYVDNAADNIKKTMPYFITPENINLIMVMEMLGIPITLTKQYFDTPIIKKYFKLVQKDITNMYDNYTITNMIGDLLLKDIITKTELYEKHKVKIDKMLYYVKKNGNLTNFQVNKLMQIYNIEKLTEIDFDFSERNYKIIPKEVRDLVTLNNLQKLQQTISIYNPLLNADKLSIAPNIKNYDDMIKALNTIDNNIKKTKKYLTSETTDMELMSSIFKTDLHPTLASYIHAGIMTPYKMVEQLFSNYDSRINNEIKILDTLLTNLLPKSKEAIHKEYRQFRSSQRLAKHPMFDIDNITNIFNFNTADEAFKYLFNETKDKLPNQKYRNLYDELISINDAIIKSGKTNEFLNRFSLEIKNIETNKIYLKFDNYEINEITSKNIKNGVLDLFNGNNEEQNLLFKLISYSFFSNGLFYTQGSFESVIPAEIWKDLNITKAINESLYSERNILPTQSILDYLNINPYRRSILPTLLPPALNITTPNTIYEILYIPVKDTYSWDSRAQEANFIKTTINIKGEEKTLVYAKIAKVLVSNGDTSEYKMVYKLVQTKGNDKITEYTQNTKLEENILSVNSIKDVFEIESMFNILKHDKTIKKLYPSIFTIKVSNDIEYYYYDEEYYNSLNYDNDSIESMDLEDDLAFQLDSDDEQISEQEAKQIFYKVKKRFDKLGIDVKLEIDSNLDSCASIKGDKLTINPDRVVNSSIHHEFGHIIVDLVDNNGFLDEALEYFNDTKLYHQIKLLYPNLNQRRLLKETLVTYIGSKAARLDNSNFFKKWFKYFVFKVKSTLVKAGLKENTADLQIEKLIYGLLNPSALENINMFATIEANNMRFKQLADTAFDKATNEMDYLIYRKNIYEHIKTLTNKLQQSIDFFALKKTAFVDTQTITTFKDMVNLLQVNRMQKLLKLDLNELGKPSKESIKAELSKADVNEILSIMIAVHTKNTQLLKDIYEKIEEYKQEMANKSYKDYDFDDIQKLSDAILAFETLKDIATKNFTELVNDDITYPTTEAFKILEPLSAYFAILNKPDIDYELDEDGTKRMLFRATGEEDFNSTLTAIVEKLNLDNNKGVGVISQDSLKFVASNINPIDPVSRLVVMKIVTPTPLLNETAKSTISKFKKQLISWVASKSKDDITAEEAELLVNSTHIDSNFWQLFTQHSKLSHDEILANVIKIYTNNKNAYEQKTKEVLKAFEQKTLEVSKELKRLKLSEENVFVDGDSFVKEYDMDMFWKDYKEYNSKQISKIDVGTYIRRFGGTYLNQPEIEDLVKNLRFKLNNNVITAEEYEKEFNENFIQLDGLESVYNKLKLSSKYIKLPIKYKSKKYQIIENNKILLDYYNYILNLMKAYSDFSPFAPQNRMFLPAIAKFNKFFNVQSVKDLLGIETDNEKIRIKGLKNKMQQRSLLDNFKRGKKTSQTYDMQLEMVNAKYFGYFQSEPLLPISEPYVLENKEEYETRVVEELSEQFPNLIKYNKEDKSSISKAFNAAIEYNETIKLKNKANHAKNVETRPSVFLPIFIKSAIETQYKKQLESYSIVFNNYFKNEAKFTEVNGIIGTSLNFVRNLNKTANLKLKQSNTSKIFEAFLNLQFYNKPKKSLGIPGMLEISQAGKFLASSIYLGLGLRAASKDLILGTSRTVIKGVTGENYKAIGILQSWYESGKFMLQEFTQNSVNNFLKLLSIESIAPISFNNVTNNKLKIEQFSNFVDVIKREGNTAEATIVTNTVKTGMFILQHTSSKFQETALVFAITKHLRLIDGKIYNSQSYIDNKLRYENYQLGKEANSTKIIDIKNVPILANNLIANLDKLKLEQKELDKLTKLLNNKSIVKQFKGIKLYYFHEFEMLQESVFNSIENRNGGIRFKPELVKNKTELEDLAYKSEAILDSFYGVKYNKNKEIKAYDVDFQLIDKPMYFINDKGGKEFIPKLEELMQPIADKYRELNPKWKDYNNYIVINRLLNIDEYLNTYSIHYNILANSKTLEAVSQLENIIAYESHYIQGIYDKESKSYMDTFLFGSNVMAMSRWLAPQIERIWGVRRDVENLGGTGKSYFNEVTGMQIEKGNIRNTLDILSPYAKIPFMLFLNSSVDAIIDMRDKKELNTTISILRRALDELHKANLNYILSPQPIKNKLKVQIGTITFLLVLALLFRKLTPDDDKELRENSAFENVMLQIYAASIIEISGETVPGNIFNIMNKEGSSTTATSIIAAMANLTYLLLFDREKQVKSANEMNLYGSPYMYNKKLKEMIPIYNKYLQHIKMTGEYPQIIPDRRSIGWDKKASRPSDINTNVILSNDGTITAFEKAWTDLLFGEVKTKEVTDKQDKREQRKIKLGENKEKMLDNYKE